jgi:hypothetical protein
MVQDKGRTIVGMVYGVPVWRRCFKVQGSEFRV